MSPGHIDHSVLDIMSRLRRQGFQAYLVGGCVRDILLGKNPKDFDVATNARPQQIKRLFRRCFLIGRRFRLAHVYISHDRFVEVATFRAAVVPEQVAGGPFAANNVYGTIEADVQRRDFTVNALYFNSADASIIDYCGGLKDLKKKIVRSIGNPSKRFVEDPVRIIRAARFCAQLGFGLSAPDLRSAVASAECIKESNAHRMLEELYKILRCGASADTIRNLKKFRVLQFWIPELAVDRYEESMYKRLLAADAFRKKGTDIPNAVLVALLLFDIITDLINAAGGWTGFQEAFTAINRDLRELALRLRLPRREFDAVCTITARYRTFSRINSGKKWKSFERRFVRNPHFQDAFLFFEMLSEAAGMHADELRYWRRRTEEAAHEGVGGHEAHRQREG
jgi:poly(A) polymerase